MPIYQLVGENLPHHTVEEPLIKVQKAKSQIENQNVFRDSPTLSEQFQKSSNPTTNKPKVSDPFDDLFIPTVPDTPPVNDKNPKKIILTPTPVLESPIKNVKVPEIKEIREMEIESKLLIEKLPSYRRGKESDQSSKKNIIIEETNEDFLNSDFFNTKRDNCDDEKVIKKKIFTTENVLGVIEKEVKPEIEFNFDEDEEKTDKKGNENSFDKIFKKNTNSNRTSFKDRFGAKLMQAINLESKPQESGKKPFIIKNNVKNSGIKLKNKPRKKQVSTSQDISKARKEEYKPKYGDKDEASVPLKPMFQKKRKNLKNKKLVKGPVVDQKNNKTDIMLAANEAEFEPVFKCNKGCGKSFKKSSLKKHENICEKIFLSKRDPYNISKKRSVSQPHGIKHPKTTQKSKSSWKEKSLAFRENLKKKAQMNTTNSQLDEQAPKPIQNSAAIPEE